MSDELDRRPPTTSIGVAVAAGMGAVLAVGVTSPEGAGGVFAGALLSAVGLVRGSRRAVAWGAGVGAIGIVLAGLAGGSAASLVAGAVALTVAWDVGDHALSLGDHVGRESPSRRNQFVHSGTGALVGLLTAGIGYGSYTAATGGQPVAALVFLLFGAVVLVSAFR